MRHLHRYWKKNDINIINLGVGGTGTFQQYLRFKTLLEYKIRAKFLFYHKMIYLIIHQSI